MPSLIEQRDQTFQLNAGGASYVLHIERERYPAHDHWGAPLACWQGANAIRRQERIFSPNPFPEDRAFSLDTLRQEFPGPGRTDFRSPAFQVRLADGSAAVDLWYSGARVAPGKPALPGLPAGHVSSPDDAQTLYIELRDPLSGLEAELAYTAFRQHPVIARSVRLRNGGSRPLTIQRLYSLSLDLELPGARWLQLSGAHVRERTAVERHLTEGQVSVSSRRGASSHQQNPFFALLAPDAGEEHGEAWGFHLVYSGNFQALAELDQFGVLRVQCGINPEDFAWALEPGAVFQAPEVILTYSAAGKGGLSRAAHRFVLDQVCRGPWARRERPILINNWEATYFDFDEAKIDAIVAAAAPLGIELFVLDDGWFGKRDDDRSGLGDWTVNRRKLPSGIDGLADRVHGRGLKFGLWLEPEAVSPDSDLYRAHPDWCLHTPGRSRSEGRSQLLLDLGRPEVRAHLLAVLRNLLAGGQVDYVKWDMNRHLTETGGAAAHRHLLGLYEILEAVTTAYPEILFESCSGGGGRFDLGMLYYTPQIWTSDNTDAVSRLEIQWGTSLAYPAAAMGAHVSASPNHQVRRLTSLKTRADVAMAGAFGYELDPRAFTAAEAEEVRAVNAWYREHRGLLQFGDVYRLQDPRGDESAAWLVVAADRRRAVLFWYRILARPAAAQVVLRFRGLEPGLRYRVGGDGVVGVWAGDELMGAGLRLPEAQGDFQSLRLELSAE